MKSQAHLSQENNRRKIKHISVIGDSTIDNQLWIAPGIYWNFLKSLFHIKRDDRATRLKKAKQHPGSIELTVAENLIVNLGNNYTVHDYTNDGFTTTDCLIGNSRSKVFKVKDYCLFPDVYPDTNFEPLVEGKEDFAKSDYIIVSIGGNNVREFIENARKIPDKADRLYFLKNNFPYTLQKLKDEYQELITKIKGINPHATLILMTQYYPSFMQSFAGVYPFMKEVGEALDMGENPADPSDVIHEIMKRTYQEVFANLPMENTVIADITSLINPFDRKNHAFQIEPSGQGGKQIAALLKYIIEDKQKQSGVVYHRSHHLEPLFFVDKIPYKNWMPDHPCEFTHLESHKLLNEIYKKSMDFPTNSELYKACTRIYKDGTALLHKIKTTEEKITLSVSLTLSLGVLEGKKGAGDDLKSFATSQVPGKPSYWKQFLGGLYALAGIAVIGLGIAGIPFTAATSIAATFIGGSLLAAGGAALFYSGMQKSFSKDLTNLVDAAALPPTNAMH